MVPWSVIITGVVGVAGIGGTLVSARWQTAAVKLTIAAEDERAKSAEKRRIYAAAYAALSDGLMVMSTAESSKEDSDATALRSATGGASSAGWELQLIASADVSRHARDALNALQQGEGETLLDSLAELIPAMRADLGTDPLDIGDLW
jgi:hypothetical protein